MAGKQGKDLALSMLRVLPRLSIANIRDNPGSRKPNVSYNSNAEDAIISQFTKVYVQLLIGHCDVRRLIFCDPLTVIFNIMSIVFLR